jgi:hypothetical protein
VLTARLCVHQGNDGSDGETGAQGEKGEPGVNGADGADGEKGEKGETVSTCLISSTLHGVRDAVFLTTIQYVGREKRVLLGRRERR